MGCRSTPFSQSPERPVVGLALAAPGGAQVVQRVKAEHSAQGAGGKMRGVDVVEAGAEGAAGGREVAVWDGGEIGHDYE